MRLGVLLLVIICLFQSIYCKLNEYEQVYVKLPNRTIAREHLKEYTSYPHIAGSTGDYKSAIYTLQQLQGFGLNASLVEHDMYANYPLQRVLRLVNATDGQIIFSANMTEPAVEVDPTSNDTTVVPTFNGYSASGNTTAPLVFANYGQIDDFEYLQKAGINITGCVVIVKYGRIFRGVKAMLAQKFGASGLLIYSDPYDDGYVRAGGENNTYPLGPWRPEYGVQRGSVQYLPICPGSPSQERMKICREEDEWDNDFVGSLIPSIPVQPISWGDALPLMRSLVGTTVAPADWQKGGFSSLFNYSLGPSSLTFVQLTLVMNYTTVPIWNVVATLSGKRSDQIVLVGNHRDAWVFGATDPNSGTSVMLEMARSLMALKNTTGWIPERDIVICSWDAEEYGLIGSTAWGEMNAEYLQKSVIAYVNTDIGVSGSSYLDIGGTPSLRSLIRSVTDDLPFPGNPNITLSEFFNVSQLGILGSGSDYTVFLDHLGIPSLDMGYLNPFEGGVYHSIYDSFYWMDTFGDPGFIFHEGMAQLMGLVVIRLSDSIAHPFNFTNYAHQLSEYLEGLKPKAPEGTYFGVLETAIEYFTEAAVNIDAQKECVLNSNCGNLLIDVEALNTRLRLSERRMLLNAISNPSDGLPYRPWYKHAIQAPGIYYGYGSQTFPGIMQGILDNDTTLIQEQVFKAAIAITDSGSALTKLSLNGTSTPALCYGTPYGSMSLVAYGGFSPVYYSIDGKEWSLTNNIHYNLSAGIYSGFARDSEGFIASIFVNVPEPKKLEISVTIHKSVATANVTNGVGNYTITWSTGESENSIALPKDGNYSVSVFSHGCSASTDFSYSADKKKKMSAGGVAGIVISVLIIIAVIVAVIFYLRKRNNKTVHYQNL